MADTGFKTLTTVEADGSPYWSNVSVSSLNSSNDNRADAISDSSYIELSDFSFGIPSGATISGIEVIIEGRNGITSTSVGYVVGLSKNDGSSYPATKTGTFVSTTDDTDTLGGSSDLWGQSWVDTDFADGTFRVSVQRNGGAFALEVDYIAVKVYYTAGTVEQEGFVFGDDDGNEASHTLDTQDTNITEPLGTKTLRVLLNGTDDPPSSPYKLKYQKNGAGGYMDVPVGASQGGGDVVIEGGDTFEDGNNSTSTDIDITLPAFSEGDLVIIAYDIWSNSGSPTVTWANGPDGESVTSLINAFRSGSGAGDAGIAIGWFIATADYAGGEMANDATVSTRWAAAMVVVPAGEFDASKPLSTAVGSDSSSIDDDNPDFVGFSANSDDAGGKLLAFIAVDQDPISGTPTGWTDLENQDYGRASMVLSGRNTAVSASESISASGGWSIANDAWAVYAFIVRTAPASTNEVYVDTSSNISGTLDEGNTSIEASTGELSGSILGRVVTASETGYAESVTAYLTPTGTRNVVYGIYDASDDSLLGTTTPISISSTGWHTGTFSTPVAVTEGSTYYVLANADGSFQCSIARASETSAGRYVAHTYDGTMPDPSGTGNNNFSYSLYMTLNTEPTTARLTAPSGKSTSDFDAGYWSGGQNPLPEIDITEDDYTEIEWVLTTQSPGTTDDYYEFRVYNGDTALDTYTVTPKWTIGTDVTTYTKTHTSDSYLYLLQTKAQTTDAFLRITPAVDHTTDSALWKVQTSLHTTDALIEKVATIEHSADAFLYISVEKAYTADSLLTKEQSLSHSTDSYAIYVFEKSHSTDSYLRTTEVGTHSVDALLTQEQSLGHTTDTYSATTYEISQTTDADLKGEVVKSHTSDSYLSTSESLSHSTDALILQGLTATHSTDTLLYTETAISQTTDALLGLWIFGQWSETWEWTVTSPFISHTTDSYLVKTLNLNHSTDTDLKDDVITTHTADSYLQTSPELAHSTDTDLMDDVTLQHSTDTDLLGEVEKAHTVDSLLRDTIENTHNTDALLQSVVSILHTIDALKRITETPEHSTDALLQTINTVSNLADALLRATVEGTQTTDSLLWKEQSQSHSTDAYLEITVLKSHTTDAVLQKTQEVSHSADAFKLSFGLRSHSTDSFLQKVQTVVHSTDTIKYSVVEISHTTDARVIKEGERSHTVDAYTVKTYVLTHTVDALILTKYSKHKTVLESRTSATTPASKPPVTSVNNRQSGVKLNSGGTKTTLWK